MLGFNQFISYCCYVFTFLHRLVASRSGTNLGQIVGAEDTDGVDDDGEGDHQVDGGGNELTRLEGDATDDDNGLGDTLAAEGGEEGRDDAIRQGGEETSHHRAEVERSGQNDDILGVEHFVC